MELISIQSFLYVLVSYLVTYFIGHITISFLKLPNKYPFFKEFSKLVLASFIIITCYSLFKTRGITINVGIVFSGLFFFWWCKQNNYLHNREEVSSAIFNRKFLVYLLIQLILLFLVFLFLLYKMKNPLTGQVYEVYGDFYNYSKNIYHLNSTGIETIFTDRYSGIPSTRSFYHFGELWQSAFYSVITGQSSFLVFYFQVFSIYLVIYILGGCALIEVFIQPTNNFLYCISVLILIATGISFYIPSDTFFTKGDWWNISLVFQPKYFFPAIFVFYTMLFTRFEKIIPLLLLSVCCIFTCTVIAPAVLLFMGLNLLLSFNKFNSKELIKYILIMMATVIFIGIYYFLTSYIDRENKILYNDQLSTVSSFSLPIYLKTAFNCFAGQLIKSGLSLGFYIISIIVIIRTDYLNKNILKKILLVMLYMHISSLLSYALFNNVLDAVQLWTNIYLPLSAAFGFITILHLINSKFTSTKIIAILLIALCFYQAAIFRRFQEINQKYINLVFQKYDGGTSVFYKSDKDFTSFFSKNVNMYTPSSFLTIKFKEFNPVSLNVLDIPRSKEKLFHEGEKYIIQNSVFYKFIQTQKKNNEFVSVEQSQLDFIEKYKVKYAFTYLNASLPDTLQSLVITSVKDSVSGITFYQLK